MENTAFERDFSPENIKRLRQLWDEGKASDKGAPLDFDELIREARTRLAEIKKEQILPG